MSRKTIKQRNVSPRSLLGLLLQRKTQLKNLPRVIAAIERRLRQMGVDDPLASWGDVWDALHRHPRRSADKQSPRKALGFIG